MYSFLLEPLALIVQPLDVCINGPFKAAIEKLATKHMQENLNDYVHGKVSV